MSDAAGDTAGRDPRATEAPLAEWIAQVGDRIAAGEPVALESLGAECPADVEKLRSLIPALQMLARLRPKPDAREECGSLEQTALADFEPHTYLGDFRTVGILGRGGMGVVYEAFQISLNRPVALKILPIGLADDPRKVKRFQLEAQAAASLHDPHIVPVYLVGSENGVHFYVMQLIEGRTLADLITELRCGSVGKPNRGASSCTC